MNNGNKILKWDSVELESTKRLLKEKYYFFLSLIDNLDTVSTAHAYIRPNSWDILFRLLNIVSNHYDLNFCVYENPHGLLFDAGAQYISFANDA